LVHLKALAGPELCLEEERMMTTEKTLFALGQVVATCGAMNALQRNSTSGKEFLDKHQRGDWGLVDIEDAETNDNALLTGARLMSVYRLADGTDLWVITEAVDTSGQRSATTLLLPDDY